MSKSSKKKSLVVGCVLLFLLLACFVGLNSYQIYQKHLEDLRIQKEEEEARLLEEQRKALEERKLQAYQACLDAPYSEMDETDAIIDKRSELTSYIKNNYQASVGYEDIKTGFSYYYNSSKVYYGASLIKIVDAIYLLQEASLGNIDIDSETVTYTRDYKRSYSTGMEKKSYGEKVSLRELISYAIEYSDNSAHEMLYDYIGGNTLKNYGTRLGAKVILSGVDHFGNQTVNDTMLYLKEAYKIITEDKINGDFLKEIMLNMNINSLNFKDEIVVAHKYGSYDGYNHDIGIAFEENPYYISVLTMSSDAKRTSVIQSIHKEVFALHELFYQEREQRCQEEVYSN